MGFDNWPYLWSKTLTKYVTERGGWQTIIKHVCQCKRESLWHSQPSSNQINLATHYWQFIFWWILKVCAGLPWHYMSRVIWHYLQSSRAKERQWWVSTVISTHPSNLDWHHAFQAYFPLLRKHRIYPELCEEIILPEARHSPVKHLQPQHQALLLTGKALLLHSGSPQQLTNLETFVSDWVPGNEPIRGDCHGSNNHETTHYGRHMVWQFFLDWNSSKMPIFSFPVFLKMTWF